MKRTVFKIGLPVMLLLFLFSCNKNQEDRIPENVLQSFSTTYPTADDVRWALKEDSYEVDFMNNEKRVEAEYDQNGTQIQEEAIIDEAELPEKINEYLNQHYPQYHIGEASIEEKEGKTVYELELLNGFFREVELEFDLDGNFLSKETFKD